MPKFIELTLKDGTIFVNVAHIVAIAQPKGKPTAVMLWREESNNKSLQVKESGAAIIAMIPFAWLSCTLKNDEVIFINPEHIVAIMDVNETTTRISTWREPRRITIFDIKEPAEELITWLESH